MSKIEWEVERVKGVAYWVYENRFSPRMKKFWVIGEDYIGLKNSGRIYIPYTGRDMAVIVGGCYLKFNTHPSLIGNTQKAVNLVSAITRHTILNQPFLEYLCYLSMESPFDE